MAKSPSYSTEREEEKEVEAFSTMSIVDKKMVEDPLTPDQSSSNNKRNCCSPVACCDCSSGLVRFLRDMPPAHYRFKIDSFSKFSETLTHATRKYYTSQVFEVEGYKWTLSLYPKGDEERNGKGHLSMFLNVADTKALPLGWEVNVIYRFFVLDQIRDKFLTIQDSLGKTCRFDAMKTESGIPQLLPLSEFEDVCNGFLVQDKCTFGAEILLICNTNAGESILPVELFKPVTYRWVIKPVPMYSELSLSSGPFTIGCFKWKLIFYPKGCLKERNNSISVFLKAVDLKHSDKVHVQFKLTVQGRPGVAPHSNCNATCCFTASSASWGTRKFLSLEEFNDPSNGYLVKDSTEINVEIKKIFTIRSLP